MYCVSTLYFFHISVFAYQLCLFSLFYFYRINSYLWLFSCVIFTLKSVCCRCSNWICLSFCLTFIFSLSLAPFYPPCIGTLCEKLYNIRLASRYHKIICNKTTANIVLSIVLLETNRNEKAIKMCLKDNTKLNTLTK